MNNYNGSKEHKENAKNASKKGVNKIKELKIERIAVYNLTANRCLCCDEIIDYAKRRNKFCSKSCSAKINNINRIITDEHRNNTSLSLSGRIKEKKEIKKKCIICDEEFIVKRRKDGGLSRQKTCGDKCHFVLKSENSKEAIKTRIENGTHKGWQSRNIESYPETFFKKVLDNNDIKYEFNKIISKRSLGLDCDANYFLDFYISNKNIDLEIDGKQHKLEDRIESDETRDAALVKNGYIVYRIEWKDINTKNGKEYIKNEIDKFLKIIKE